ncbi:MAG: hypothetical protein QOE35_2420 [Actinomycetota bacterium]|jgi:CubicO group peptidase (beta-lactamase class C family)
MSAMLSAMRRSRWVAVVAVVAATIGVGAARSGATAPARPLDQAALDRFVQREVRRNGIPGLALGVVDGNRTAFVSAFGKGITTGTPFLLGSVSKPLTAVAVMQLVESGKVDLDGPVQRYVPSFRVADAAASRRITVRQLLTHTSGIPNTACETEDDTLEAFVATLRTVHLDRPVGSRYEYCSGNYNLLGLLIERVSGQPYGRYMEDHVFAPLRMRDSFGTLAGARADGLAAGHRWIFGRKVAHTYYNPSGVPAGYLASSASDMTRLLAAEMNGGRYGDAQILSPAGIAMTQRPMVKTDTGAHYGFGWETGATGGVPTVHHGGVIYDYESLLFMEPSTHRGAVILINAQGVLAITAFHAIEGGVARMLAGRPPPGPALLTVGRTYAVVDLVLLALLYLVVRPFIRLRRWSAWVVGRGTRLRRPLVRAGVEVLGGILLVLGVRMFFTQLGARNWFEIISLVPDLVPWVLVVGALLVARGVTHAVVAGRARRSMTSQTAGA